MNTDLIDLKLATLGAAKAALALATAALSGNVSQLRASGPDAKIAEIGIEALKAAVAAGDLVVALERELK